MFIGEACCTQHLSCFRILQAPSYSLSPALGLSVELQLEPPKRLRNGSFCQPPMAGGSRGVVHVLLDLALPLLQGDELYIWLPPDQLISSCQLSDSDSSPPERAPQASLCGDPAELEIDWEGTGGTVPPVVEVDPNATSTASTTSTVTRTSTTSTTTSTITSTTYSGSSADCDSSAGGLCRGCILVDFAACGQKTVEC